jgi:putative membrane protein
MKKIVLIAFGLLTSACAYAQSLSEKTGINSAMGIAPTTADFVKEAAISDMFEIDTSQLASQGGEAKSKAFATQMIEDHQKTSSQLKSMVQSGSAQAKIPTALDGAHKEMLEKLRTLHGHAFVTEYRRDQISGHEDAVALFRRYAQNGDNAQLKNWAGQTLPTLEHHLELARNLPK